MLRPAIIALFLTAIATGTVFAAKPGGPPSGGGTTDPQVGYIRILPSGSREIRLAGADGTGSVALATTRNRNVTMSLSPQVTHQIAYTDGPALKLLTYEMTSTGPRTVSNISVVTFGNLTPAYVDFSPAGTHLVYFDPRDNSVYVHDLATNSRTKVVDQAQWLGDLEFSHDGSKVIYSMTVDSSLLIVQFRYVPITGGASTDLPIRGKYGLFSVGHSDDRIVADTMGEADTGAITLFPADGSSPTRLATGYAPALLCGTDLLYQRRNLSAKGSISILKLDLTSNATTTYSSADNMWADTFPDCQ
jgi:DNA-binding beta-propeller fold protein YncE